VKREGNYGKTGKWRLRVKGGREGKRWRERVEWEEKDKGGRGRVGGRRVA